MSMILNKSKKNTIIYNNIIYLITSVVLGTKYTWDELVIILHLNQQKGLNILNLEQTIFDRCWFISVFTLHCKYYS